MNKKDKDKMFAFFFGQGLEDTEDALEEAMSSSLSLGMHLVELLTLNALIASDSITKEQLLQEMNNIHTIVQETVARAQLIGGAVVH